MSKRIVFRAQNVGIVGAAAHIALGGLCGQPTSDASMNPACILAPDLVAFHFTT